MAVHRVVVVRVVVVRVAVEQQGGNPRAESGAMRHLGLVALEVAVPALVVAVPALVLVEDLPPQVANWGQPAGRHQGLAVPALVVAVPALALVLAVPELEAHQLEVQVEGLSEPD